MSHRSNRGSALLVAVVVVLIVTLIGVGIVNFASREVAGATSGARRQGLVACAEAARQLLVSRFHAVGLSPAAVDALDVSLDGSSGGVRAVGGHVDQAASAVQVNQVQFLPDNAFGPVSRARDITNTVSLIGQGGKPLRVVAHCVDAGGRQLEVEFGVRFGL